MNSKKKGDLAEVEAIRHYTRLGHQVLVPVGDRQAYDLVVDDGGTLFKVQCKFTSQKKPSGSLYVRLFVGGGNRSSGNYKKRYAKGSFDFLFVLAQDGSIYVIPEAECLTRSADIVLTPFRVETPFPPVA